MDVWEVPVSSCPGLDRGPLMDVGPQQIAQRVLRRSVDQTEARDLGHIVRGLVEIRFVLTFRVPLAVVPPEQTRCMGQIGASTETLGDSPVPEASSCPPPLDLAARDTAIPVSAQPTSGGAAPRIGHALACAGRRPAGAGRRRPWCEQAMAREYRTSTRGGL